MKKDAHTNEINKEVAEFLKEAGLILSNDTIDEYMEEYFARGGRGNFEDIADFIERQYSNDNGGY